MTNESKSHSPPTDNPADRPNQAGSRETSSPSHPQATSQTDLPASEPRLAHGTTTIDAATGQSSGANPSYFSLQPGIKVEQDHSRSTESTQLANIKGYEILGVLGRGGMGIVYRARQRGIDRIVALKMLLAGIYAPPDLLARFDTERRTIASMQHPNIVQIYEVGQHDGLPFFSFEYLDGGSLAQKIGGNPQPVPYAAKTVELLARAMQYAHDRDAVHRDLKPANVLLTSDGQPKITDFGLAKRLEVDSGQTRTGVIMGSPSYMAPEQARGAVAEVGPLSDVYALGAILYELLTGRPPFLGESSVETLSQVVNHEPVPPRNLQPKLPENIETICLKCLEKEPKNRYPSCSELADELERFLANRPIKAKPARVTERLGRWCQRNPGLAGSIAVSVTLLIAVTVVSLWSAIALAAKNTAISKEKEAAVEAQDIAQMLQLVAENAGRYAAAAQTVAESKESEAKEAHRNAGKQADNAVITIQKLMGLIEDRLSATAATQSAREQIKQLLRTQLRTVAVDANTSKSEEPNQLSVLQTLGALFRDIGESYEAKEEFTRAAVLAHRRVELKEGSDTSRRNLARALRDLGDVSQEVDRSMQNALSNYEEALVTRNSVLENPKVGDTDPANRFAVRMELAEDYTRVATAIYRLGDPERSFPYFQNALQLRTALSQTADTDPDIRRLRPDERQLYLNLRKDVPRSKLGIGELNFRLGRPAEALRICSEVVTTWEALAQGSPGDRALKHELCRVRRTLGDIKLYTNDIDGALSEYEQSRALLQELVNLDTYKVGYKRDLALAHYRLGTCATRRIDQATAAEHFLACREIREGLVKLDMKNDRRWMELMLVFSHCGDHIHASEIAKDFAADDYADNELLLDISRCFAQCSVVTDDADLQKQYTDHAVGALKRAIDQEYHDPVYLESEPDLDPLRERLEFQSLVERARVSTSGIQASVQ